jgi:hypothetical protein
MAQHEIIASIRVTLPDDPQQMAERLSTVAGAWAEFLAVMEPQPESTFSVNETRGKPGPKPATNGAPRQRRQRATGNSTKPTDTQPGGYDDCVSLDEARGILRPDADAAAEQETANALIALTHGSNP